MKRMSRALPAALLALFTMAIAVFANPTPSFAYSQYRCNYPYACVYAGDIFDGTIVGRYQDVTNNWQNLPHPRSGDLSLVNTRNDDVLYYLYSLDGWPQRTGCVMPNQNIGWYGTLYAVRIDSHDYCSVLNPA